MLVKMILSIMVIAGGLYLASYVYDYAILFTLIKICFAATIVLAVIQIIIKIFKEDIDFF